MHELLGYLIAGLVTASIYAIVACGLTLTHTTTGIFNWAHGALVAVGSFSYWQLTVGWGWPRPLAVAACLLVLGPGLGVLLEVAIMHRLQGTSEATRMVVTLALLLGTLAGLTWIWDPALPRVVQPLLPGRVVTVFDQRIPWNDVVVMGVALAVALALRGLLHRTRTGVDMRAVVDDRELATIHGASVARTAATSWAVGCTLAVLAGILIAPRGTLSANSLALLIVNAYAAAIIGRLRSLPMTFVGALVLGLSGDLAQGYVGSRQDLPGSQYLVGLVNVLPVITLFLALQLVPSDRLRAARSLRIREVAPTPTWRGSLTLAAAAIGATVALAPLLSPGDLNAVTRVWGLALVALSLVPLVGYAGRLSACPLSFAAIGAIVTAHLGSTGNPAVLLVAAAVAGAVGAVVSLTALRLSGLHLALATAAFAVMLDGWIFRLPPFTAVIRIPFTSVTLYRQEIDLFQGGALHIPRFQLLGIDTASDHATFVFGAVVFAIAALAVTALRRSDLGLRLVALKDSPVGYATLGLDGKVTTLVVFATSAAIAGLGGAVYGAAVQRPAPDLFSFFTGLGIIVAVVILGVGSIGAAIAAGTFVGGPTMANLFPGLAQLSSTLLGTAGIGLGRNPNGIAHDERLRWRVVARRRARALLAGALALVAATYALAVTDTVGNWVLVGVVLVVVVALPAAATRLVDPPAPEAERDATADGLSAPPERLGFTAAVQASDLDVLARELALPPVARDGS